VHCFRSEVAGIQFRSLRLSFRLRLPPISVGSIPMHHRNSRPNRFHVRFLITPIIKKRNQIHETVNNLFIFLENQRRKKTFDSINGGTVHCWNLKVKKNEDRRI
jgi:hypothetical protein